MMKKNNIIVAYHKYCFITIEYLEYTCRIYIFSKQKLIIAIKRKKNEVVYVKIILT